MSRGRLFAPWHRLKLPHQASTSRLGPRLLGRVGHDQTVAQLVGQAHFQSSDGLRGGDLCEDLERLVAWALVCADDRLHGALLQHRLGRFDVGPMPMGQYRGAAAGVFCFRFLLGPNACGR